MQAIKLNWLPQGTALSPTATFNPNSGAVLVNFDPSSVWGQLGVWGVAGFWGNALALGTNGVTGLGGKTLTPVLGDAR